MEWLNNSVAGWATLIAGMTLISAAWLTPFVFDRLRRGGFFGLYHKMVSDPELRMMAGFVLSSTGMAIFAVTVLMAFLMLQVRAFHVLTEFTSLVTWTLILPSALLIVSGKSMMLWDGYSASRGKRTCLWLLGISVILWTAGTLGTHWFVSHYY